MYESKQQVWLKEQCPGKMNKLPSHITEDLSEQASICFSYQLDCSSGLAKH